MAARTIFALGFLVSASAHSTFPSILSRVAAHSLEASGPPTCTITSDETCDLKDMDTSSSTSTLVDPGGDSRCIFSDSGAFKFQVWPGASDKLLIYFQGGGACWDKVSTEAGLCTTYSDPTSADPGVFCRDNCPSTNPFSEYTIVQVLYCSGDAHVGNVVRDYSDSKGEAVTQMGAVNVQMTLDWIKSQTSYLTKFNELVLMGCSAGSLGVQAWSHEVLSQMKASYGYDNAAVVPDSYAGVFPPGTQGQTIKGFGACTADALNNAPELVELCNEGELTLQEMSDYAIDRNEDVQFAFLNSKEDEVQIAYYVAIGATFPNTSAVITPEEYFIDINVIFGGYADKSNVVQYLVDSDQHCYTNNKFFWTADATGKSGGGDGVAMIDWVGSLPLHSGEEIEEVCVGEDVKDLDKAPKVTTKYCFTELENTIHA